MDATKWTQGFQEMMNVKPMEQIMIPNNNNVTRPNTILTSNNGVSSGLNNNNNNNNNNTAVNVVERKSRPQEKLNCPRCNSTNTKFCYYNNYSLTQPRYFCKGCRRYWTEGGSLRNVPVGGSSRKNKRSSSSSSSSQSPSSNIQTTPSSGSLPDLNPPILFSKPKGSSQDLNLLSFPVMQQHHHQDHQQHVHMSQFLQMPKMEGNGSSSSHLFGSSSSVSSVSALELLRGGGGGVNVSSRSSGNMLNSFMPPSNPMMDYNNSSSSSGFPTMVDNYKPSNLSFSSDHHQDLGHNNNNNRSQADQGRVLFPFGDQMKELSSSITQEVDHHHQPQHDDNNQQHEKNNNNASPNNGYWSGMFSTTGGGSSW